MNGKSDRNILLISFVFSPNVGGVESHLDDLCTFLISRDYKVTIITYKPLDAKEHIPYIEKKKNLEIRRISWFSPKVFNKLEKLPFFEILYLVPPILFYSIWFLILNKRKIDVIQVHGFNMAIVGGILSFLFGKKLVVNTHVSFYFEEKSLYAKILKVFLSQAEKILVLTKEAKKELKKIGIKSRKVVIYRQWIDDKTFKQKDKTASRKKLKLSSDKFIALFIGRLAPAKGVGILLEAVKKISDNIQLIIVGSGPLKNKIEKLAIRNKNIYFAGKVPFEDLPYYYSAADLTIIPSTPTTKTYSEGIPRVMIESFSCGTPVAATKTGGIKEHINKNNGFIINPDNLSIVDELNKLSRRRKKILQMGKKCIKYAQREFGLLKNAKIIEESIL